MNIVVIREPVINVLNAEAFTPGKVYIDGQFFCFSCEDEDRFLEKGNVKVYGRTAIPRGLYSVVITMSNRFKKLMPLVVGVTTHDGIRFHGANRAEDLLGCIGIGKVRTSTGIAQCADTVQKLNAMITKAAARKESCSLEVK